MAIPPLFVSEYETAWNLGTSPRTATPTTVARDVLAIFGLTEGSATTINTPTGNSLTYALATSSLVGSTCQAYMWTTTDATGAAGWTLSATRGGSGLDFGFNALRFSGAKGFGAANASQLTTPDVTLVTTRSNSAVVVAVGDFTAGAWAGRTWKSVNGVAPVEVTFQQVASHYTVAGAYYANAGAAGSNSYGLSIPNSGTFSTVAVEILGLPMAGPPPRVVGTPVPAADRAANW